MSAEGAALSKSKYCNCVGFLIRIVSHLRRSFVPLSLSRPDGRA